MGFFSNLPAKTPDSRCSNKGCKREAGKNKWGLCNKCNKENAWGNKSTRKISAADKRKQVYKKVAMYPVDKLTGKIKDTNAVQKLSTTYRTRIRKGLCPECGKTMTKRDTMHRNCAVRLCEREFITLEEHRRNIGLYTEDGRNRNNVRWDEPGFRW